MLRSQCILLRKQARILRAHTAQPHYTVHEQTPNRVKRKSFLFEIPAIIACARSLCYSIALYN